MMLDYRAYRDASQDTGKRVEVSAAKLRKDTGDRVEGVTATRCHRLTQQVAFGQLHLAVSGIAGARFRPQRESPVW